MSGSIWTVRRLFFLVVLSLISVDQWGRAVARKLTFLVDFSWLKFELHWNEGFFGGSYSELSPLINQVFLSSMSLLVVMLLSLIGFLYRKDDIPGLTKGLWLFGLGLSANVLDRIFLGRVTDWVILKIGFLENYAFNLADLLILAGVLTLSYLMIFKSEKFWRDSQAREKILVEKKFQFGMAFFLIRAALAVGLLITLSSFIFFRLFLMAPSAPISIYLLLILGVALLWVGVGTITGLSYSRSLFGPVLALENLIDRALKGKCTPRDHAFALRKGDSFQHLNELGREIAARSLSNSSDAQSPDSSPRQ